MLNSSSVQASKMLKHNVKPKSTSQTEQELLYRRLELILKQMLMVLAKESVALSKVSGKSCGNLEMFISLKFIQTRAKLKEKLKIQIAKRQFEPFFSAIEILNIKFSKNQMCNSVVMRKTIEDVLYAHIFGQTKS